MSDLDDHEPWPDIGMRANDDGVSLPFAPDREDLPPLPPWSADESRGLSNMGPVEALLAFWVLVIGLYALFAIGYVVYLLVT